MPEYQNPQQEPQSTRLLTVFAVTFLFLIAFQFILSKYGPKKPVTPPTPGPQQAQTAPPPAATTATPPAPQSASGKSNKSGAAELQTHQAAAESETVIENDLYRITFSNRGGQVKSWVLKKYTDDRNQPLNLVNDIAARQYGYPLSLYTYDNSLRDKLNSALYVASVTGQHATPADLTFEYSEGGLMVRKTFHFDESYVVSADVSVTQNGAPVQAFPSWPAGFGDQTVPASYAAARVDWEYNGKVDRTAFKKVSSGSTLRMPFNWGGATDQYFSAIFLPDDPSNAVLVTFRNTIQIPKNLDKPDPSQMTPVEVLGAASGNPNGATKERIFIGPKNLDVLNAIHANVAPGQPNGPDLHQLVDFGFFSFIARPLFAWLRWTQDHWIGNWGWAIVFLTIVINLALLPLRITSMKSALKMQRIQPQINSIKEKYKKYSMRDQARQQEKNQEIAAVMKESGVNPAGGCLPLLVQFPFLVAFYTMLGNTIELRHAPWFWVHDLSSADPYHILPIGIILSTFLVQRMTPAAGMDPNQQKIMNLMMPVMLGVISWNLSAGLCLYWTVGNIIAMLQQLVMNKTSLGSEMKAMAAKRARKQLTKR